MYVGDFCLYGWWPTPVPLEVQRPIVFAARTEISPHPGGVGSPEASAVGRASSQRREVAQPELFVLTINEIELYFAREVGHPPFSPTHLVN
jgi:hypothetical protein